jgi:SAM-dependent methyltransferase
MFNLKTHWDSVAQRVAERGEKNYLAGYNSLLDKVVRKNFLKMLRQIDVNNKSVIELGSGTGLNIIELAKMGSSKITGIDISEKMIAIAKANVTNNSILNCQFYEIDGVNIHLPEKSIDIGLTVTVLQHNSNDDRLQKLITCFSNIVKEKIYVFEDTAICERGSLDYKIRTIEYYTSSFEANGFEVVKIENINMYVTLKVFSFLNKFFGLYSQPEGASSAWPLMLSQYICLPVTMLLDKFVKRKEGLTMIIFKRFGS